MGNNTFYWDEDIDIDGDGLTVHHGKIMVTLLVAGMLYQVHLKQYGMRLLQNTIKNILPDSKSDNKQDIVLKQPQRLY
jgi:Na+/alanine symporter